MVKPKNEGPSYLIDDALVKIEREQGMNRRTFVKGGVALAAMLAMGGAMGTYAWFTGSEVKENKTSIADNLEIEVVEPNFPSSGIVENVVPGAVIPKDPSVVNKSDVLNGYLFTEIRVPIAEVLVEGSEVAERLPLFSFEPNDGWKLLQEFEDGDEKVFRYGWTEVVEHGGQTGSVFDTVTFVNLTGSAQGLDVGEQLVKVIGYGIQDAEAFEGDVAKAWNAYKLQNGITDGVGNKVSAALIAGAAGNKLQFVSGTPSVGDVLDAGEVIEVVEDVEHLPVGDRSPLVSSENIGSVTVVEDVVATKPENTVNWFKDMDSVTEIDISGLDTSEVTDKTGMFDGTTSLESIKIGETTDVADVVPGHMVGGDSSYDSGLKLSMYKGTSAPWRVSVYSEWPKTLPVECLRVLDARVYGKNGKSVSYQPVRPLKYGAYRQDYELNQPVYDEFSGMPGYPVSKAMSMGGSAPIKFSDTIELQDWDRGVYFSDEIDYYEFDLGVFDKSRNLLARKTFVYSGVEFKDRGNGMANPIDQAMWLWGVLPSGVTSATLRLDEFTGQLELVDSTGTSIGLYTTYEIAYLGVGSRFDLTQTVIGIPTYCHGNGTHQGSYFEGAFADDSSSMMLTVPPVPCKVPSTVYAQMQTSTMAATDWQDVKMVKTSKISVESALPVEVFTPSYTSANRAALADGGICPYIDVLGSDLRKCIGERFPLTI